MSVVIKAENISKKYIINHQDNKGRYRYSTLRESMYSLFSKKNKYTKEEFWALKDINFEVNQGDKLGIIGRNGAGKSTLLKILSRITEPTTGKIGIKGKIASLLEVGTGFHPELTGRENIFLNGSILGMTYKEIKKKFEEIVDFAGIENFLDTPVKRYSSGMYVRLAFSVAAHLNTDILLVDEVLAVGDAEFQKKCLGKMDDISKSEGKTILFVSHNMASLEFLCKKALLLKEGKLLLYSDIKKIINKYIDEDLNYENALIFNVKNLHRSSGNQNAIEEAWIENENEIKINRVIMGEKFIICFKFNANKILKDPGFGFGIDNFLGQRICTFGNYVTEKYPFNNVKTGIVKCLIYENRLLPGKYYVSLGLSEQQNISIDYIQRAFSFSIENSNVFENGRSFETSHGFFYLKSKFFLKE